MSSFLPLAGVKVIDLGQAVAMPFCTLLLADMGADVIKVESPIGDHYRYAQDGAILLAVNRNKRGIVLDLKEPEGQEIILKMVRKADVFVESFVPGTVDKFGLSYDKVSQMNPGIIYCSISGFGQTGPYRQRPGYDPIAQAMSGIMIATGEPNRPPVRQVISIIDEAAGLYCAYTIVLSLMDREKTGKGQRIDISLLDTALSAINYYLTQHSFTGKIPSRMGSGHVTWTPYQVFDTKDSPIFIGISTDRFWRSFCQALDLDALGTDPRYSTNEKRCEHRDELVSKVSKVCKQYDSAELESKLAAVGVPCGRLLTVAEVSKDPHVQFRRIIEESDYPGVGTIKTVRTPIMVSGELPKTRMQAPRLGEHTSHILAELGYSEEEVRQLMDKGVALQYGSQPETSDKTEKTK
jgi:formyl-CoA transferase/CoA:oxalate CoA-transferase